MFLFRVFVNFREGFWFGIGYKFIIGLIIAVKDIEYLTVI